MESPRGYRGALITRIVKARSAFGMLSVVFLIASGAIGVAGGTATQASTAAYSVTDLGTLGGSINDTTQAYAINGNGQIVGKSVVQKIGTYTYHAFIYSAGKMTDLGTLPGGDESEAHAIDKYGDVAGFANTCKGCYTDNAFLYRNGKMKDLGTLGGGCSFAYGMNDFAEVVGQACASNQVAFLYSGGKMTDLGTLGGCCSSATAINNSHQVVGGSETSTTSSSTDHAVLWSNGRMTDLGTLGGCCSVAYAINDLGQIVGYATPLNRSAHAFLYSGGTMTDLGVFYDSSVAYAINNSGVVVGESDGRAVIFSGGKLQDLNQVIPPNSGWTLTEARGINDTGQIVCNGYNASGYSHAFLLNPI